MGSTIRFVKQNPPEPKTGGAHRKYEPILQQLKESDSNEWVLLATFDSPTGARDAKHRLVTGRSPIPEGTWQWSAVTNPTTSDLYVRYGETE